MTTMDYSKTLGALRRLKVNTGSLACTGCGMEHSCGIHGCAIIRNTVEHMEAALSKVDTLDTALDAAEEEIHSLHSELSTMERCHDAAYSSACKERDELKAAYEGAQLALKALNEKLVSNEAKLQKSNRRAARSEVGAGCVSRNCGTEPYGLRELRA